MAQKKTSHRTAEEKAATQAKRDARRTRTERARQQAEERRKAAKRKAQLTQVGIGVGVLVLLDGGTPELARQVAMHISFAAPEWTTRDEVPAEVVEAERDIYASTDEVQSKPEAAREKIVAGMLNKRFFAASPGGVLADQAWIHDSAKSVGQVLQEAGASVVSFARLSVAGITVDECGFTHLAYAQEIAGAMLRRQQAQAVVAARKTLVEGAVGMAEMALAMLSEKNVVELDDERRAAMVSNLMVVLCGERDTQPRDGREVGDAERATAMDGARGGRDVRPRNEVGEGNELEYL